ncbi:hypothetical protein QBL02_08730 [Leucobacter sp. UT-8R-CII-1-4]|uniref:hypothetical protein n=1 Tax=Leucobacter sp. UT-8R-CII-1-4 TaxID=3040075 RepID=UPI0024A7C641|nr:hypothetical protein [Leucobacter sp. UT-8R-CII-1-4]MDI6023628.1 hypothetical protein [Leucobacter sp. UT-8R-CII-1-4]
MSEDSESYSQAEIVRLLKGLSDDLRDLRGEVHALGTTFVTRAELAAWQTSYDREVKELKENAKPVKVSGWTVAGFFVAALVGLGSLLGLAITLITVLK